MTIYGVCDTCDRVPLEARDVTVRVCMTDCRTSYRFRCPTCGLIHLGAISAQTVNVLLADHQVNVELWCMSPDTRISYHGPTINATDLLNFTIECEDDQTLAQAVAELG